MVRTVAYPGCEGGMSPEIAQRLFIRFISVLKANGKREREKATIGSYYKKTGTACTICARVVIYVVIAKLSVLDKERLYSRLLIWLAF